MNQQKINNDNIIENAKKRTVIEALDLIDKLVENDVLSIFTTTTVKYKDAYKCLGEVVDDLNEIKDDFGESALIENTFGGDEEAFLNELLNVNWDALVKFEII